MGTLFLFEIDYVTNSTCGDDECVQIVTDKWENQIEPKI